jgi:UDP-2-acetamido-3-amino-2,3-dideoxy-glucuronate N-acetyltransferase
MSSPQFFVHPTAVVDEGAQIAGGTRIWHFCHIYSGCRIGPDCSVGQNCVIFPGVVLGRNVKVQNNVSLYEGVCCEDDVFLGPSVVFTNVRNPRSAVPRKGLYTKTQVGRGASIGANATVVCGVDIGAHAFIGAGAVVTRDVPPSALVLGNPARHAGWMSQWGHRLHFDKDGEATCPESGMRYRLQQNQVSLIPNDAA